MRRGEEGEEGEGRREEGGGEKRGERREEGRGRGEGGGRRGKEKGNRE